MSIVFFKRRQMLGLWNRILYFYWWSFLCSLSNRNTKLCPISYNWYMYWLWSRILS